MENNRSVNSSGEVGTSGPLAADRSAIAAWLDLIHPLDADGYTTGLIHICSVGNWEGRTFSEHRDAVDYVMRLDGEGAQGIYLRTTTLSSVPREYSRGSDADSKILPGFAADMDIAGPGHKTTKPLPETVEQCQQIIDAASLPEPTLWVHSGGGVYPWWLLEDGLDLTTPDALEWAQGMSTKLHDTIAAWAQELGWFYGSGVKDMSRVLRIPGTVNRKPGTEPRMAHIIQPASYEFYSLDWLKDKIDEAHANRPTPKTVEAPRPVAVPRTEGSELRPGDDFNDRAHWADILTPHGWTYMYHRGSTWYWRRPGKDSGEHSATTGRKGVGSEDRLYVFSDATSFEQNVPYNKFAAYALLNHGGDFAAATRDLRSQGFGGELPQLKRAVDVTSLVRPAATPTPVLEQPVDDQKSEQALLPVEADEALPVVAHAELPEIDLGSEQESIVEIARVINSGYIPNLYVKDGQLVYVHPKSNAQCAEVCVVPVTADLLNFLLAHHVRTHKWVNGGKGNPPVRKPCAPMISHLRAVASSSYWPGVKPLNGVIGTPTLRPDGSLIQDCGYDEATGLYLSPVVQLSRVPDVITDEQVRESREFVFGKVFGEFCWATPGDFANYMSLLLSPMLRPYVKTTTPFGLITATTAGSGKTNLSDAIGMIYGQSSQTWPHRPEELQKLITSILVCNAKPVVVFDNLVEGTPVRSEVLAGLITKHDWDARILGKSITQEARNDRLWLATGNGLTVGGDMASRTVLVRLDPRMEKPQLRTFEMGQFSDWITEPGNRADLLYHLLVLVQAWMKGGAPMEASHLMRGFTRWAQAMGGLLAFHGLTGFLSNVDDLEGRDTDQEEWATFLRKWYEVYGTNAKTAKDIQASSNVDFVSGAVLDRWSGCFISDEEGKTPNAKKLSYMLRGRKDKIFGPYTLRSRMNRENTTLWWVEMREEE